MLQCVLGEGVAARVIRDAGPDAVAGLGADGAASAGCGGSPVATSCEGVRTYPVDVEGLGRARVLRLCWLGRSPVEGLVGR